MEANSNYGIVSGPSWDEVLIVGGGLSAREFDFSYISPELRLLAVNDAIFLLLDSSDCDCPTPAPAVFSLDPGWLCRRRDFLSHYQGEKYCAVPLETFPEVLGIRGMTYLHLDTDNGLNEDPRTLNAGGNSGYAALNLAYLKKAKKIYLIGYDMYPQDNDRYEFWMPRFRSMVDQFQQMGIAVLNLNPRSYIDAFPKVAFGRI